VKPKLCHLALVVICMTSPLVTYAQDNPLAKYLEVPGAKTTLPVSGAKSPFSLEFVQDAQKRFENL